MPKLYGNSEIWGDLLVTGSFSILGSASTIDTTSLVVSDSIIALGHSQSGTPVLDEGIMFVRGLGLTQAFIWDESDDTFALISTNDDHTVVGNVSIDSYSSLRVGGLTTSTLTITSGAQSNYILISDSFGNASWTASIPGTSGTSGTSGVNGTSGTSGTSGSSGTLTLSGTTDNGIITLNGSAPNATVESNLIFDGSNLSVIGNATFSGNVGIGVTSPTYKLEVSGTVSTTGFRMTNGASNGYYLKSDASGNGSWVQLPGGLTGSGTTNYLSKWTGSGTLGNSLITDNGSVLGVNGYSSQNTLSIYTNNELNSLSLVNQSLTQTTKRGLSSFVNGQGVSTNNTGVYISVQDSYSDNYGIYSQVTGSSGSVSYGFYNYLSILSGYNYGIYNVITNGANLNYGNYTLISGTYGSTNTGSYTSITSTGQSFIYGSLVSISTSNTTRAYGVYSLVKGASNMNVGVWGVVGNSPATTSADIGGRFIVNSGATLSTSYGVTIDNTSSGTGQKIGASINVSGYGSSQIIGIQNLVSADNSTNYGLYNQIVGTSGTIYGIYNNNVGYYSGNIVYGLYNNIADSSTSYGVFNLLSGTTSGSKYGVYTNISGDVIGTKTGYYALISGSNSLSYGVSVELTGTGSQNCGVYVNSESATTNYGVFVNKGTSIFNFSSGQYDFQIKGDTDSNLFYAKASTNNIGIGTDTPNTKSILDVSSTTKGFLPPRMSTTQREAITSPPAGLLIFNTDNSRHEGYTGTTWSAFY